MQVPAPHSFAPLRDLYWRRFQLTYRAQQSGPVPQVKSSALRGMLGHALRKASDSRLYDMLFECHLPQSHPYSRRFQTAPNPYILYVPDQQRNYLRRGDPLVLELTLIGRAADEFHELLPSLQTFRGLKFGKGKIPLMLEDLQLLPARYAPEARLALPRQPQRLTLEWQSPLHIKENGKVLRPKALAPLVKRISERLALLAHFHCDAALVLSYTPQIALADSAQLSQDRLRQQAWPRYSQRSQQAMSLSGWVGSLSYQQVAPELLPLLRTGSCLHLGKATVWGMGRYRVREQTSTSRQPQSPLSPEPQAPISP